MTIKEAGSRFCLWCGFELGGYPRNDSGICGSKAYSERANDNASATQKTTSVVLDPNGAENASSQRIKAAPGESIILPSANIFKRSGFKAIGWNTEPDGQGVSCGSGSVITAMRYETSMYVEWEKSDSEGRSMAECAECSVCHQQYNYVIHDRCPNCQSGSFGVKQDNDANKARQFIGGILSKKRNPLAVYELYGVRYMLPKSWDPPIREADNDWESYWHYRDIKRGDLGFIIQFAMLEECVGTRREQIDNIRREEDLRLTELEHCVVLSRRVVSVDSVIANETVYTIVEPNECATRWISRVFYVDGGKVVIKGWCSESILAKWWNYLTAIFESISTY